MRNTFTLLASAIILCLSSALWAQTQVDPVTQLNWPALSGTSAPASYCPTTTNGTTTSGSATVTVPVLTNVLPGAVVTGTGVTAGSVVDAINAGAYTVTLSQAATASGTVSLSFYSYGMPYTDTAHNVAYTCTAGGWAAVVNATVNAAPQNSVYAQIGSGTQAAASAAPGLALDGANGLTVTGAVTSGGGFTQTGTSANTFTGATSVNGLTNSGSFTQTGTSANTFTGTTTLPVIDNGGQVFNVKAYGATGNGTTDDTAAIQAAITAAVVTGGTVFFPPGTYDITSTLGVPSQKVRLVGASELSVEILCNVSSGDCIKFAPNLSSFRDADGGLYHLSVWLNGTNQIGVHTVDFFQGFHLVDANIERSSATYGVGSIGWLAENDGAFAETQTERSVLDHAGFAYDDIGIKAIDTASSGTHNSLEHSQWLDVRWNLGTNQIAIQLANDVNMTDSYINGTVNPTPGATGISILSLTGTSDTNPIYGTIYIDGGGTGITGATTASGTVLVYNGFMGTYSSNSCAGSCILPPPDPSSFEAYSGLYSAKQLGLGDGSANGYVTLIPSGGTTYLESSSTGVSGNCQPVGITGAAASPNMMLLDCNGDGRFYGYVNAAAGYQINGSYGAAGQVLTSTGSGTTFAYPVVSGTMTGTGTSATHTFTTPFTSTPQCILEPKSNVGTWFTSAESSTSITVTYSSSGTSNWDAICTGSGGVW